GLDDGLTTLRGRERVLHTRHEPQVVRGLAELPPDQGLGVDRDGLEALDDGLVLLDEDGEKQRRRRRLRAPTALAASLYRPSARVLVRHVPAHLSAHPFNAASTRWAPRAWALRSRVSSRCAPLYFSAASRRRRILSCRWLSRRLCAPRPGMGRLG